jgi:hypothetical protein
MLGKVNTTVMKRFYTYEHRIKKLIASGELGLSH